MCESGGPECGGMEDKLLQYAPFKSVLDVAFWYHLTKQKLNVYMLDDRPISICGYYSNKCSIGLPPIANIDYTSFNEDLQVPPLCFPLKGILINTNTLEDFKNRDKIELIYSIGNQIWEAIKSGDALKDPSLLQKLICFTFADLKKYHYYYWIAFPALTYPETAKFDVARKINEVFTENQINQLLNTYDSLSDSSKIGFLIHVSNEGEVCTFQLTKYEALIKKPGKVYLGFSDPSTLNEHPGWPLRNILSLAAYNWGKERTCWEVLCFREFIANGKRNCEHSILLSVQFIETVAPKECPKTVGWEKNKKKLVPKMVDMSSNMDPVKLADAAVDLNLKLMRWRLLPELELDIIKTTKCLLFGAGTLGCNVARCLLGWGVRKITFVDNAHVSYSNPVRQTLFKFSDSLQGGKHKATAAAEALKEIFPQVECIGKCLNVPMPGHALSNNTIDKTRSEVSQIEELIESHDVIFLLMDTRESRWLPTVIGTAKSKIIINAALGFDTFLVMRHGMKPQDSAASGDNSISKIINGDELGCYFCNDVVAPGNSTHDRTLDQQCTVTRPGVSYVAAALAVELMVSILQHPNRGLAPASISDVSDTSSGTLVSVLGLVPHQIRGYLERFQNVILTSKGFDRCTACSHKVLQKYKSDGFNFLLQVFSDSNYLEELTGLSEMLNDINIEDVYELSDDGSI